MTDNPDLQEIQPPEQAQRMFSSFQPKSRDTGTRYSKAPSNSQLSRALSQHVSAKPKAIDQEKMEAPTTAPNAEFRQKRGIDEVTQDYEDFELRVTALPYEVARDRSENVSLLRDNIPFGILPYDGSIQLGVTATSTESFDWAFECGDDVMNSSNGARPVVCGECSSNVCIFNEGVSLQRGSAVLDSVCSFYMHPSPADLLFPSKLVPVAGARHVTTQQGVLTAALGCAVGALTTQYLAVQEVVQRSRSTWLQAYYSLAHSSRPCSWYMVQSDDFLGTHSPIIVKVVCDGSSEATKVYVANLSATLLHLLLLQGVTPPIEVPQEQTEDNHMFNYLQPGAKPTGEMSNTVNSKHMQPLYCFEKDDAVAVLDILPSLINKKHYLPVLLSATSFSNACLNKSTLHLSRGVVNDTQIHKLSIRGVMLPEQLQKLWYLLTVTQKNLFKQDMNSTLQNSRLFNLPVYTVVRETPRWNFVHPTEGLSSWISPLLATKHNQCHYCSHELSNRLKQQEQSSLIGIFVQDYVQYVPSLGTDVKLTYQNNTHTIKYTPRQPVPCRIHSASTTKYFQAVQKGKTQYFEKTINKNKSKPQSLVLTIE